MHNRLTVRGNVYTWRMTRLPLGEERYGTWFDAREVSAGGIGVWESGHGRTLLHTGAYASSRERTPCHFHYRIGQNSRDTSTLKLQPPFRSPRATWNRMRSKNGWIATPSDG